MTATTTATGVAEDYEQLRTGCGLIARTTTSVIRVAGPGTTALLSSVCSRSVDFLLEGQIQSALLTDTAGNLVAELLVHCLGSEFLLEVDTDRVAAVFARLRDAGSDASSVSVLDDISVIGIEGPESPGVVQPFLSLRVDSMAYPSFVHETFHDVPLLVSRTGLSGEYGFTFHVPAAARDQLWDALQQGGAVPVSLDALDVCRLEMRFPNLTIEAPEADATPFTVGLQWMVDFAHEFPGKLALLNRAQNDRTTALVCWRAEAGSDVPATGTALTASGAPVGRVRHALYSPGLQTVIGVADVEADLAASGLDLTLESGAEVRTVSAPFRKATSLGRPMIKSGGARPGPAA